MVDFGCFKIYSRDVVKKRAFVYTLLWLLLVVFLRAALEVREFGVFRVFGGLLILVGGGLGAMVLNFEERLMTVLGQPADKPVLRNVLCQVVLLSLAFYIGTSTVSLFPLSFVLGFLVRSLVEQYLEVRGITSTGSVQGQDLGSWFWVIGERVGLQVQRIYLGVLGVLVLLLSSVLI